MLQDEDTGAIGGVIGIVTHATIRVTDVVTEAMTGVTFIVTGVYDRCYMCSYRYKVRC